MLVGCSASAPNEDGGTVDAAGGDGRVGADGAGPRDLAVPDLSRPFAPPSGSDDVLQHALATSIPVQPLPRSDSAAILDISVDSGGGIWAVSTSTVYYWPSLKSPFTYHASNGLARKNGANLFASVAGGLPGQAVVGNRGAIADRLEVDPQSGAIQSLVNLEVPFSNSPEYVEHLIRVVAGLRVVIDLKGTFGGTAYIGGIHGFTTLHGLTVPCKCIAFQEHQHFMPSDAMGNCDSTVPPNHCWGGDVKGLAISPNGDLWAGDEHFVSLLPQRSLGLSTDFFQPFLFGIDVFPLVNDEVSALASDGMGGVWVASFGNGLAYLEPLAHLPSYFDRAKELPQNRLTAVLVDDDGSVWVGTTGGGIARYFGKTTWRYYTAGSGLPSDGITSLAIDHSVNPRRLIIGTVAGVAVYSGM